MEPDSPSYRFMGFVPVFEKAGFREVGRAGTRRHVMHENNEMMPNKALHRQQKAALLSSLCFLLPVSLVVRFRCLQGYGGDLKILLSNATNEKGI